MIGILPDFLIEMFSFTFLVRAFVVGMLVSLCASLLGVSLVMKRFSMIGDRLSHVGFGALAVSTAVNAAPLVISIPVVVAAAFLLLRLSENSKIKGDAAIALISTSFLALGVVIISQTTGMNTDVCNYLFGSILAMSRGDVYLSVALSIIVLVLFVFFYHKLFAITFDETFARAAGVKTSLYNMLIALLTALTIVLGMRMMGAMLISSLIIFPSLSAMRVFKRFKTVTICAAVIAALCFFIGIVVSYLYATPAGASVVMINIFTFLLFWAIGSISRLGPKRGGSMKKAALASLAFIVLAASCARDISSGVMETETGTEAQAVKTARKAVPDFIEIKERLFIAQINDVYLNPDEYLGKVIKLEGLFKFDQGDERDFRFVMRYGPGCCGYDGNAGFEVCWEDPLEQRSLPAPEQNAGSPDGTAYPQADAWVEAQGTLKSYREYDYTYLYLALSELNVLETRGAEFVSQ